MIKFLVKPVATISVVFLTATGAAANCDKMFEAVKEKLVSKQKKVEKKVGQLNATQTAKDLQQFGSFTVGSIGTRCGSKSIKVSVSMFKQKLKDDWLAFMRNDKGCAVLDGMKDTTDATELKARKVARGGMSCGPKGYKP